jgi:hypothetical protein
LGGAGAPPPPPRDGEADGPILHGTVERAVLRMLRETA